MDEVIPFILQEAYQKTNSAAADTISLLGNEDAREVLLQLSRDFEKQKQGRMFGKKTENAKHIGAPAWKSFILGSLRSKEYPEGELNKITVLVEGLTYPSLVDLFVDLSKILIEQNPGSSSTPAARKRKGSVEAQSETAPPNHKKVAKPTETTQVTNLATNGSGKPPRLDNFTALSIPSSVGSSKSSQPAERNYDKENEMPVVVHSRPFCHDSEYDGDTTDEDEDDGDDDDEDIIRLRSRLRGYR